MLQTKLVLHAVTLWNGGVEPGFPQILTSATSRERPRLSLGLRLEPNCQFSQHHNPLGVTPCHRIWSQISCSYKGRKGVGGVGKVCHDFTFNVTPKLHMLEDHVVPFLRRWRVGLGMLNELGTLQRTYGSMRNKVERLKCVVEEQINPQNLSQLPLAAKRRKGDAHTPTEYAGAGHSPFSKIVH